MKVCNICYGTGSHQEGGTFSQFVKCECQKKERKKKGSLVWTDKWPTEPGRYWFYGYRFPLHDKPDLFTTHARLTSTGGVVLVCDGQFLYKEQGAQGMFAKLKEPTNLPKKYDKSPVN